MTVPPITILRNSFLLLWRNTSAASGIAEAPANAKRKIPYGKNHALGSPDPTRAISACGNASKNKTPTNRINATLKTKSISPTRMRLTATTSPKHISKIQTRVPRQAVFFRRREDHLTIEKMERSQHAKGKHQMKYTPP